MTQLSPTDLITAPRFPHLPVNGMTMSTERIRELEAEVERLRSQRVPRKHSDAHYQRIADLQLTGAKTIGQIADEYGVARTTVQRWVYVARQRGLLPPTIRGRSAHAKPPCPTCGAVASAARPHHAKVQA